jgi:protease IV
VTKRQKITIGVILGAPVVLGIVLMTFNAMLPSSGISMLSQKKIGLVKVTDVIYSSEEYVRQLRELREDNSIAGVLLRIDSPGGAVAPSQEIFAEIMKFRDYNKPLVVSMGNLAASGGYYIASPALKIFANPGTVTGSIGVILSFPHYYKLLNKLGVDIEVLKSGAFKDIGSSNREMKPEERQYLQTMLDDIHSQFIEDVSRARSIDIDSLIPIADGRIFTGRQALKVGLIDTLGGYEDALAYLKAYTGVSHNSEVIEEKIKKPLWKQLLTEELFDKFPLLQKAASPAGSYYLCDISVK